RAEAALRLGPTGETADLAEPPDGRDHFVDGIAHESGPPVVDSLGQAAAAESDYRRAAQHRLRQHDWKRLFPFDRRQQRRSAAKERDLLAIVDRADVADPLAVDARLHFAFEVFTFVSQR